MAPKSQTCNRCKRSWSVPNPLIKNPEPSDTLKRRGVSASCTSCWGYCNVTQEYEGMSGPEIVEAINKDQEKYNQGLMEYEESRRENKRMRKDRTTTVSAQTTNAVASRKLLGFLWPLGVLRQHKLEHLWAKLPRQTITHMGKPITGVLRDISAVGAIELFENSEVAAVRKKDVAERVEAEEGEADDCFQGLGQQLRLTKVSQDVPDGGDADGEAGFCLKGRKGKRGDDDDFAALWGISGLTSFAAGSNKGNDVDGEDELPKKRAKVKAAASGRGKTPKAATVELEKQPNAEDTASQADVTEVASSSSWLFDSSKRPGKPKGSGKGSKDLEASDKVLVQFTALKRCFSEESSFLSVTFSKTTALAAKLEARNTPELQKVYRELTTSGNETERAVDILRRLAAATAEVSVLGQLVSAIHDAEATAATLAESISEAESLSLVIPSNVRKMQVARVLLEFSAAGKWTDYLTHLESTAVSELFAEDKDALEEFQFCSLKTNICKWLQKEICVIEKPASDQNGKQGDTSEDGAEKEKTAAAVTGLRYGTPIAAYCLLPTSLLPIAYCQPTAYLWLNWL